MNMDEIIDSIKSPYAKAHMSLCIYVLRDYKQMIGKPIPWMSRRITAHDIDVIIGTILVILKEWVDAELLSLEDTEKLLRED